ncbi:hypothetical protein A361_20485 [Cytobacillus oceanisediminis 2691]|uniref:Uncharacterized protein n=1 Tax=Cytobacillus oceanisediminis 2691 TaxID=1196031 RepID=A0A160MFQ8_9BACI|nr:hypothetical protein A361_20485 [Cytobacillus oceanisediminis 2691]
MKEFIFSLGGNPRKALLFFLSEKQKQNSIQKTRVLTLLLSFLYFHSPPTPSKIQYIASLLKISSKKSKKNELKMFMSQTRK